ncbi:MAG: hypothetical protein QJR09_14850 [Micrococcus sp.]|nr:hypothetical protein [Micrococcus sp.]
MSAPSVLRRPLLRVDDVLLAVLASAAGPLLWWLGSTGLAPGAVAGLQAMEFLVASACAVAGALLAAWWFVALVGTVMTALGHRWRSVWMIRWGQAVSPMFLRRVAASVLGINLLVAPGAWAGADEPRGVTSAQAQHHSAVPQQAAPAAVSTASLPRPGWLAASSDAPSGNPSGSGQIPTPTWRPSAPAPPVPGAGHPGRTHGATPMSVTVRAGDCLWDIAAEELGPYATDLEIDRRWRQWYRLNQPVIGPDADVLAPGTVLQAPPVS